MHFCPLAAGPLWPTAELQLPTSQRACVIPAVRLRERFIYPPCEECSCHPDGICWLQQCDVETASTGRIRFDSFIIKNIYIYIFFSSSWNPPQNTDFISKWSFFFKRIPIKSHFLLEYHPPYYIRDSPYIQIIKKSLYVNELNIFRGDIVEFKHYLVLKHDKVLPFTCTSTCQNPPSGSHPCRSPRRALWRRTCSDCQCNPRSLSASRGKKEKKRKKGKDKL